MTDLKPILSDADGARAISRMIDAAGGRAIGVTESGSAVGSHALVVQLVTAIAAGSTTAVKADIMDYQGGVWSKTGQQIDVSSLTGLAVSTSGRRIARKISRFGWGVVET
jgi:hypothetical protein